MPGGSSSAAAWSGLLEPANIAPPALRRPDDPRLAEVIERWNGDVAALRPGRAVIVGFPQDEGVRRNGGRVGAAQAPDAIRAALGRLTPYDGRCGTDLAAEPPLDAGNVRVTAALEASQEALGQVVGGILASGAVPVVLGGGHETAYGHYLGYVSAGIPVGIVNIDAHLDVRPLIDGRGHSGSPFRQALEHPTQPLLRYCCVGAQPFAVAREHLRYVQQRGGQVVWRAEALPLERHLRPSGQVLVTVDADAFAAADVPGVSAPNAAGLPGADMAALSRAAGALPDVASFEVVEINPRFDVDGRSVRWAAVGIWEFLVALRKREA